MLENMLPLVIILNLALLLWAMIKVGAARGKYGVKAPATTGHPAFDCAYRVQMNLLEQTVMFLPALWLCHSYTSAKFAVILGLVWVFGRTLFAWGYYTAPEKRGPGFLISFFAFAVLFLAGIYGYGKTFF